MATALRIVGGWLSDSAAAGVRDFAQAMRNFLRRNAPTPDVAQSRCARGIPAGGSQSASRRASQPAGRFLQPAAQGLVLRGERADVEVGEVVARMLDEHRWWGR